MARITTAHVELDDGTDFVAEIANLTLQSVFVRTRRSLGFRAPVTITFFSVSIRGEIAFRSLAEPCGWVVSFRVPPPTLALLEARLQEVEVLPTDDAGLVNAQTIHFAHRDPLLNVADTLSDGPPLAAEISAVLREVDAGELRKALSSSGAPRAPSLTRVDLIPPALDIDLES